MFQEARPDSKEKWSWEKRKEECAVKKKQTVVTKPRSLYHSQKPENKRGGGEFTILFPPGRPESTGTQYVAGLTRQRQVSSTRTCHIAPLFHHVSFGQYRKSLQRRYRPEALFPSSSDLPLGASQNGGLTRPWRLGLKNCNMPVVLPLFYYHRLFISFSLIPWK